MRSEKKREYSVLRLLVPSAKQLSIILLILLEAQKAMVPPSQKPARLEAASFIISAVEGKHFSLAQLIYAEPKRRRAAYLIDESKTMIEILKLDIDADGQAAWGKLLRR